MLSRVRENVRAMAGYTPGEQPRTGDVLKLNTNENPYPPSPTVFEAVRAALTPERLRKYPDPMGQAFRESAGRVLGVDPDGILIGNGSDDILTILTRAFVPEGGLIVSPTPSYTLYRTLADIQGCRFETVPFTEEWGLPDPWPFPDAHLTFVPNPNSPSSTVLPPGDLQRLIDSVNGPVVLDEAYADFASENGLALIKTGKVIVTRTFSKAYSLAGLRFGYGIALPELTSELVKVKDSYNCDVIALTAARAAIEDQAYFAEVRAKILRTRDRLTGELHHLGFEVTPSSANFVWCRHVSGRHRALYESLKERGILVRYMKYPDYGDGLRITVGTETEIDRLLEVLQSLL